MFGKKKLLERIGALEARVRRLEKFYAMFPIEFRKRLYILEKADKAAH